MKSELDPDIPKPDAGRECHEVEEASVTLSESASFSYGNLIGCLLNCDFSEAYNRYNAINLLRDFIKKILACIKSEVA